MLWLPQKRPLRSGKLKRPIPRLLKNGSQISRLESFSISEILEKPRALRTRGFLMLLLMAHRALHLRWPFRGRKRFLNLRVAVDTGSMKRLLIIKRDQRRAALVFDLGDRVDQFRLCCRFSVTFPAAYDSRSLSFLRKKLSGQGCSTAGRP